MSADAQAVRQYLLEALGLPADGSYSLLVVSYPGRDIDVKVTELGQPAAAGPRHHMERIEWPKENAFEE